MKERQEQCESWKVTDMQIPGRERFTDQLKGLAEEQYRIFNQKFVLTNRNPMLGVKVPKMRGIAKEIVAGSSWREFLAGYGFYVLQGGEMDSKLCRKTGDGLLVCKQPVQQSGSPDTVRSICSGVFFEEIMIIGITGKSGAGKSYLSDILSQELDLIHVNIDKISHEVLAFPETISFLKKEFENIIFENNKLNRKKLGEIVFNNPQKLQLLNDYS